MKYNVKLILLVLVLAWLLVSQVIFLSIQSHIAGRTAKLVEFQVKDEVAKGAPDKVATSISTLESLEMVRCFSVNSIGERRELIRESYYRGGCNVWKYGLGGKSVSIEIQSIGGSRWEIEFLSQNPTEFYVFLYFVRSLGIAAILFVTFFFKRLSEEELRVAAIERDFALELSRVARQVAHDIRSPLSYLRQFASVTSNLPEALGIATNRIDQIANDLLENCKRPTSDSLKKKISRNSKINFGQVSGLIFDICEEKRALGGDKIKIEFKSEIDDNSGGIEIDEVSIYRAFSNLISNSVDAIVGPGIIRVTINQLGISAIRVVIQDSGCGMNQDELDKLGRLEFTAKEQGSGLGFLSAKRIVESVGGDIKVASQVGVGTLVEVTLPG